jgi:hypothetical protein
MGIGTIAVIALFFLVLLAVFLYGQFVWSFTQWDMADVSLEPYKSLAYVVLVGTFVAGSGVGLWLFGGSVWGKQNQAATAGTTVVTDSPISKKPPSGTN